MILLNINPIIPAHMVPVFMILMGIGMIAIWTIDISRGKFGNQGGFFRWTEGENRLWPHILAEYSTGILLIIAAVFLLNENLKGFPLAFISLGAMIYSSINSTGWVILKKERLVYGIPMWTGLACGAVALVCLFAGWFSYF